MERLISNELMSNVMMFRCNKLGVQPQLKSYHSQFWEPSNLQSEDIIWRVEPQTAPNISRNEMDWDKTNLKLLRNESPTEPTKLTLVIYEYFENEKLSLIYIFLIHQWFHWPSWSRMSVEVESINVKNIVVNRFKQKVCIYFFTCENILRKAAKLHLHVRLVETGSD